MAPEEADDNSSADSQPRCEIAKIILEEECQRPGAVRYGGTPLCGPHAALLGLEERAQALLGSVFLMDEWMEVNGSAAADDEFVGSRQGQSPPVRSARVWACLERTSSTICKTLCPSRTLYSSS